MWQLDADLVRRLYVRAGAERWQLDVNAFAAFLFASAHREFGGEAPDARRLERHYSSLHLEDLALACACAEGNELAWDEFIVRYRPVLYRAADALDPSGGAREAADSLYAELFGLRSQDGKRQSHLRYFHGRSSLATWLRAVLAQRYVDRRRAEKRTEPLPEDEAAAGIAVARPSASPASSLLRFIERVRQVMTAVIAALPARDRLRLQCYYAQDLTLAQIGRMLSESEATASRSLARTRRAIREQVEQALEDEGMSEGEIAEGFAAVVEDAGPLDLAEMLGGDLVRVEEPVGPDVERRKKTRQDRSK